MTLEKTVKRINIPIADTQSVDDTVLTNDFFVKQERPDYIPSHTYGLSRKQKIIAGVLIASLTGLISYGAIAAFKSDATLYTSKYLTAQTDTNSE